MARDTPMSFRAPPEILLTLSTMAQRDALSPSAWLREAIAVISTSGLTLDELVSTLGLRDATPPPNGHHRWRAVNPTLGRSIIARTCLHPAHLIERFPTFDRCACGTERYR